MLQYFRRIGKENTGQSVVELALVLPLIFFLLLGVVEFGRMFHAYLVITQGSREGARLAVVGESDTVIMSRIDEATASLKSTKMKIAINPGGTDRIRGVPVHVTVHYDLDLIFPNLFHIFPDPFVLSSTTVMRME